MRMGDELMRSVRPSTVSRRVRVRPARRRRVSARRLSCVTGPEFRVQARRAPLGAGCISARRADLNLCGRGGAKRRMKGTGT